MKKKCLLILCIITLCLSGCRSSDSSHTPAVPSTETDEKTSGENTDDSDNKALCSAVSVTFDTTEKTYQAEDSAMDFLRSSYTAPAVTVLNNEDASEKIQDVLSEQKKSFTSLCKSMLADAKTFMADTPNTFSTASLSLDYEVKRCDEQTLSFESLSSEYPAGSVHGDNTYSGLTFDAATGKRLTLDDIAADKKALLKSARNYILSQLKLPYYSDQLLVTQEELPQIIDSDILIDNNWYFTHSGITFISNAYLLAPYSSGAFFFTVPYQQLEGLHPKYQYTGTFELSTLVGSTMSADINGDESADAIYYDSGYNEETGVPSATLTVNGTDYSALLTDNGCMPPDESVNMHGLSYYLIDLDTADDYIELAIPNGGTGNHCTTHFFRFVDYSLVYMGAVDDSVEYKSFRSNGDGTLTANMRTTLFGTAYVTAAYEIDKDLLAPADADWYYLNHTNLPTENAAHPIQKEVTVYAEDSRHSDTVTLTDSDGPVVFTATDNEHWVILSANDNAAYYLYLEDTALLENGESVFTVFGGLE